jgi:hypothetical protein
VSEISILNTSPDDIDLIFYFFDEAIKYQKRNNFELWPTFERALIEKEILENRHWKIVEDGVVVCIFSIQYDDPIIWGQKNNDPAVYIHRIAVNPVAKGRKLVSLIRSWALIHAKQNDKKYVRMDTWGKNQSLRKYYIDNGFNYLGQQFLTNTQGLPKHYGGDELSLFEIEV